MVRLSENQSKEILSDFGVTVPDGSRADSPEAVRSIAEQLDSPVVIKAQVSVTKRADRGLIRFAASPQEAAEHATALFGRSVDGESVTTVRVEKQYDIETEWYAGVVIDSAARKPRVLFSTVGGTGVEQLTQNHPNKITTESIPITRRLYAYEAYNIGRKLDVHGNRLQKIGKLITALSDVFRSYDARSVEVNPIAITPTDEFIALDARISIDDAAVSRHPEIDVEIAREFGRAPTELEKIAYRVEEGDYRGTFYFIQTELDVETVARGDNYIGFHGAGGGGSMMSMDAVVRTGLQTPNYTDTSGNPPASKVYKAARVMLSQPGIVGYLYSGSGAASQEMYTTARGLMKAFIDEQLTVPAVLRLGGNAEAQAIDIVDAYADQVPAPIEAYGGEQSAQFCADRLQELIEVNRKNPEKAREMTASDKTPDDVEFDLEIDESLEIAGLDAYRDRIKKRPAVAELTEVPHKWVF